MFIRIFFGFLAAFFGFPDLLAEAVKDRNNRNDRGKLKKASDKYVC